VPRRSHGLLQKSVPISLLAFDIILFDLIQVQVTGQAHDSAPAAGSSFSLPVGPGWN
jgi:hypothetical protein